MSASHVTPELISNEAALKTFLSSIPALSSLYVDCEGLRLSRHGTLCIVTILIEPQAAGQERKVQLVDVSQLKASAFSTAADNHGTLKSILEDPHVTKYVWDVRNDANALWGLYNVRIAGVVDVQLLELASRHHDKTFVRGLDKAIANDLKLAYEKTRDWRDTKKAITQRMAENVFEKRPMEVDTMKYCANDVSHLPALVALYKARIEGHWHTKAALESQRRVAQAQSLEYDPQSPLKTRGPWVSGAKQSQQDFDWYDDEDYHDRDDFRDDDYGENSSDV